MVFADHHLDEINAIMIKKSLDYVGQDGLADNYLILLGHISTRPDALSGGNDKSGSFHLVYHPHWQWALVAEDGAGNNSMCILFDYALATVQLVVEIVAERPLPF